MRILPVLLSTLISAHLFAENFYVGTYTRDSDSKGIYLGQLDPQTGKLGEAQLASPAPNPSYLALSPNGKFLYAALEDKVPSAGAFRVEANGKLTLLNQVPSGGADPCHVSVDRTGKFLFVANYTGGSVASFAIKPGGSIGDRKAFVQFEGSGPNKDRQQSPHAHGIFASPDNRFVYACDLGTDKVRIFHFDAVTGALVPATPAFALVPGGAGPRHLAFSIDGKYAFVSNEMGLSVTAFRRDKTSGALSLIKTLPVHPSPASATSAADTVAEIEVHPSGKWLYVSSRGDDTLAVFSIASDGWLSLVENVPSVVKVPRGFAIDPSGQWLVVAGQNDNSITTFRIDPQTGRLTPGDGKATVGKPVSILFAQ